MLIKSNINKINSLIINKKSFIVCTYYLDAYSNLYTANLNKELKNELVDIYYLEVEDFMNVCNLNKRIFPIFCIFVNGKLSWKKCGFIPYTDIINEYTKIRVLFS